MNPDNNKPSEFTQAQAHEMWDKINELKSVVEYHMNQAQIVKNENRAIQEENSKLSNDKFAMSKRCKELESLIVDMLLEVQQS